MKMYLAHFIQRIIRGYSDLDVYKFEEKMRRARDLQMPFNMNKYEFRAMNATVNQGGDMMGNDHEK